MATENLGTTITLLAGSDLHAYMYRFVTPNAVGKAALTGDGEDAIGVLQNDPAAVNRDAGTMVAPGKTKITAGAITTPGHYVASDSVGRAVDAASGDFILGWFLDEAATVANQQISMVFQPGHSRL